MPAPKGNNYAKGNKGGNPGYGKLSFIREKVKEHAPLWWEEWGKAMQGTWETKRVALQEFNKLQTKMIPQDVDMEGKIVVEVAKVIADKYDNTTPDTGDSSEG